MIPVVKRVPGWFAERSATGNTHQNGRRLAAHRVPSNRSQDLVVRRSGLAVFVVTLSAYVAFAVRYMRRHSRKA